MLRHIAAGIGIWLGSWLAVAQAETFPYLAYVQGNQVVTRSGPAQQYYPTEQLQPGEAVEVYRHDPGGWCAIRPPEHAFSWVAAEFIDVDTQSIGTVNAERMVVRTGSQFSGIRDAIQIELKEGDTVEVLEVGAIDPRSGAAVWYKIAPPAGEFRWVAARDLVRAPIAPQAVVTASHAVPTEELPSQVIQAAASSMPRTVPRELAEPLDPTVEPEPVQRAVHWEDDAAPAAGRGAQAIRRTRYSDADAIPATPVAEPESAAVSQASLRAAAQEQELDKLHTLLTGMVAEDPRTWDFVDLYDRAELVLERAETAVVRGRARLLLKQLDRFDSIQQRYEKMPALAERTTPRPGLNPRRLDPDLEAAAELVERPTTERPIADRLTTDKPTTERATTERSTRTPSVARTSVQPRRPAATAANSVGQDTLEPQAEREPVATPGNSAALEAAGLSPDDPRFDGVGRLQPVHSMKVGAPRYALIDEAGNVRSYITPAPGVSLRRYLGKRVGVVGTTGVVPELNAQHVIAKRVLPLDDTLRK